MTDHFPHPRVTGQPDQETFADFWIAYQLQHDASGFFYQQVYYGESKNEVLETLQKELRGLGLKKQDLGERVKLHRDGHTLFMVVRQLLNYGFLQSPPDLKAHIPELPAGETLQDVEP